jgi:outer membrane immunogenic protein
VLGGTANAGHLPPTHGAPMAANPVNWTGLYGGGSIGFGKANWTDVSSSSGPSFVNHYPSASDTGFLGGLQAGYNYQMGNWVVGVEGAWTWTDLKPTSVDGVLSAKIRWIASVTGRVGVSLERWLPYVGGGAAWAPEKVDALGLNEASGNQSGWTVLAGVEYAFDPRWSARIQYNHYDFGSARASVYNSATPPVPVNFDGKLSIDAVEIGLNYRFGG